ncbi:hypothetical protein MMC34_006692 [Xylographa carneopallida]|nr:hypothetical protein [Xylographa carneopallida]
MSSQHQRNSMANLLRFVANLQDELASRVQEVAGLQEEVATAVEQRDTLALFLAPRRYLLEEHSHDLPRDCRKIVEDLFGPGRAAPATPRPPIFFLSDVPAPDDVVRGSFGSHDAPLNRPPPPPTTPFFSPDFPASDDDVFRGSFGSYDAPPYLPPPPPAAPSPSSAPSFAASTSPAGPSSAPRLVGNDRHEMVCDIPSLPLAQSAPASYHSPPFAATTTTTTTITTTATAAHDAATRPSAPVSLAASPAPPTPTPPRAQNPAATTTTIAATAYEAARRPSDPVSLASSPGPPTPTPPRAQDLPAPNSAAATAWPLAAERAGASAELRSHSMAVRQIGPSDGGRSRGDGDARSWLAGAEKPCRTRLGS